MKFELPDVDLDVGNRDAAVNALKGFVVASQVTKGELTPHPAGIYFQSIPVDPITNLSSFPYKEAEELGYYKIDLLQSNVYSMIEDNEQLEELLALPVDWDWFIDKRFYENDDPALRLVQLGNYYDLMYQFPPKSIEDLAIIVALIRPPKNRYIREGRDWEYIKNNIYVKDTEDGYYYKKSSSIAFSYLVTLHAKIISFHLY